MADMPACIDLLWGQSMVGASPWLCLMAQTSSHDSLLCIGEAWGFRQLSVLSGCLAESSCGCAIHVLLRVKCISQSVSQRGAAAQWIRALKISQVLWLSEEVCIDGNTKTSCCWQFVIVCVCVWMFLLLVNELQMFAAHSAVFDSPTSPPVKKKKKKKAINWISQHLRNCAQLTMRFRLSPGRIPACTAEPSRWIQ